ncbi:MAG: OmpH family outer membrane protein [Prevotellaceae bacterium]|jgi:outer membrane protein|nr:OmpH family outer membrane protein [Prevotellaceae bacterium]
MIKKITLLLAICALPLGAMAQQKFGHVNQQEIITLMPEFAQMQTEMEALNKTYQDELQIANEEFNRKYQDYMQQVDSLPKNILERRQKELADLERHAQEFQQEAIQNMNKAQNEKIAPILQKLNAAIETVSKAEGCAYVFDPQAAIGSIGISAIPYVGTAGVDLTPKVKAELGIK